MRVIVAGSRSITDPHYVRKAIRLSGFEVSLVVCGEANGVDKLGADWARQCSVSVASYPADWKTHGYAAGFKRNRQMADNADALIAIWDGRSRGTEDMIQVAKAKGLRVFVYVPGSLRPK